MLHKRHLQARLGMPLHSNDGSTKRLHFHSQTVEAIASNGSWNHTLHNTTQLAHSSVISDCTMACHEILDEITTLFCTKLHESIVDLINLKALIGNP